MRRKKIIAGVVVWAIAIAVWLVAATDIGLSTRAGTSFIIGNARLTGTATTTTASLVIEDGRIAQIVYGEVDPAGRPVFDAAGRWVAPGLVDVHAHMLRAGYCSGDEGVAWDNLAQIPFNFDVALASGVTTVVDLGGPLEGVLAIRDRLAEEGSLAPRYLVAGPILTAPNGYPLDWADHDLARGMEVVIELPDEAAAREAITRIAEAGVDVVKIASMELGYDERPLPAIAPDVMKAAVDEAHRRNLRVFVHAHTNAGYRNAIDAGADVIAHSTYETLPDAWIAEIVEKGIVVVPTLWVFDAFRYAREHPEILDELRPQLRPRIYEALEDFHRRHLAAKNELPPDFLPGIRFDRTEALMGTARENLRRLSTAGATIAFGSDTSFCYALHGSPHRELEQMVRAGMTPRQAFHAATVGSAVALDRTDLGRITTGAAADLLVLDADPREDPRALAAPIAVVQGGRMRPAAEVEPPSVLRTLHVVAILLDALYL